MGIMEFFASYKILFGVFLSDEFKTAMSVLYGLFPFWGPVVLAFGFYMVWVQYVRTEFLRKQKYVLLEIRLPKEVFKSPQAMELALSGFYVTAGESTWYDLYILGKSRPYFSLEIASFEGTIHFYVWTREGYRNVVEAQLYGQYPDIEIFEVPDYTEQIPYNDPSKALIFGCEYGLEKPDPYPIKTYVDYGLDKDPKEEFKVDPMTTVLEYMAGLKKGEQIWLQFIIQAHRKKLAHGSLFSGTDVQEEGKELVQKLLEQIREERPSPREEGIISYSRSPTRGESEVISAIERSISKLNFDCGIRVVYATKPDAFVGVRIPQLLALFRAFATKHLNNIVVKWLTVFNYPWEDFRMKRSNYRRGKLIKKYRMRAWFHPPFQKYAAIFSTEELATLFHLPGQVLQAPSVPRVMSKKAEAPLNLPQ